MDSFFVSKNRAQKRTTNKQNRVCHNYQQGKCTFGDGCRFSHDTKQRAGVKRSREEKNNTNTKKSTVKGRVCKNHLNGGCKWGDKCKFAHKEDTRKQKSFMNRNQGKRREQVEEENNSRRQKQSVLADDDSDEGDEAQYRRRRDPGPAPGDDFPSDVSSSEDEYAPRRRDPGPVPPSEDEDEDENSDDAADSEQPEKMSSNQPTYLDRLEQAAAKSAAAPIRSDEDSSDSDSDSSDDSDGESSGDEVMGARVSSRRAFGSQGVGMGLGGAGSNVNKFNHTKEDELSVKPRYLDGDSEEDDDDDDANDDNEDNNYRYAARKKQKLNNKKSRHAPAEMSSKQAVSRYRVVVPDSEVSAIRKRDPRFDNLSGKLNRGHWETAYNFIDEYKTSELKQLRENSKKEKDLEVKAKMDGMLSRESNRVQEREIWKQERAIVQEHRRNERKAISEGRKKTPYHLSRQGLKKKGLEKKFETLKKAGKVDKYMEKRRKKNSMKDRRRLPQNFQ